MNEIWKPIKNYEGLYEVSNKGSVRSVHRYAPTRNPKLLRLIKGQPRKTFPNGNGYLTVVLSKNNKLKTFTVHQLVAQAFIPNFIKGTMLNHIDGNPKNNDISNLEVSNPSHNQLHAVRTGLKKHNAISNYRHVSYVKNPRAKKKWAVCIRHAGKSSFGWKTFMTEEEAAKYADELLDSIGDTSRLRNFPKVP